MRFEAKHDRDAETLSDLALTPHEGDGVKAGIGVDSGQLTIQVQISESGTTRGHADFQYQADVSGSR